MKKVIHTAASVSFEMTVINPDGSIARRLPRRRNLLLDTGLNRLANQSWCSLFSYFSLGTSSNPTSRDSGAVTLTIAGGTATASAGFFEAADVGRLIKCDSGEERTITAYTSPTIVTVAGADVAAATQFTVWYVNDTAHGAEVQRYNLLSGDAGDHGWNWNGATGVLSTWVTRVSNAVTAPAQTFKEIGWCNNAFDGILNGRALINGGIGDTLVTGQKYKVKVTLERTLSPLVSRACPAITGWGGTATEICELLGFSYFNNGGAEQAVLSFHEPYNAGMFMLSAASDALRAPIFVADGNQPNLGIIANSYVNGTNQAYTANSFTRDTVGFWDAGVVIAANIRSIIYGDYWNGYTFGSRMLMDADHAKTSADKLTVTLRKTWGRILVN